MRSWTWAVGALALATWLFAVGCSDDDNGAATSVSASSSGSGGSGARGGGGAGVGGLGQGGVAQIFPEAPIIDGTAPVDAPTLFGDPNVGDPSGGPCLVEPEIGALFPNNWLRPRFRYLVSSGQNLFEIRLSAASQVNDLVVFTSSLEWTMPLALWQGMAASVVDEPITVAIRGAVYDGMSLTTAPALGSKGAITVAPVPAAGTIVYWTTTGGSSLKGFAVGEEQVQTVLEAPQVQMPTSGGQVTCIGCHTSTPDGLFASFTAQAPWANAIASVETGNVGQQPSFLTQAAIQALTQPVPLGIHSYSAAHWSPGDRTVVTPRGDYQNSELTWFDLEATAPGQGVAYDVIARTGDPRGAGSPSWSHDGNTIVYVSTNAQLTGRLDVGEADLYAVAYNDRVGGNAMPISGASEPTLAEYYPAFSADDQLLAFNSIPVGNTMYDQPLAELQVMPASGGTATRLQANDPASCSGAVSPGVTNSWPKWAPETGMADGRSYHWMIFSSRRYSSNPQLYMTGVVVGSGGIISTYSAVYLWNQPANESNHTPAWDVFKLPPPP
jgi:mono/diheme cytochrome c family protein